MAVNRATTDLSNGGYGWVILGCCSLCVATVLGMERIHGLCIVEIMDLYDVNRTGGFLVVVMVRLFDFLFAPVVGKLLTRFEYSVILCWGSFLVGFALILTACSNAYWQTLITYGCLQGLGINIVVSTTALTIGTHFNRRRSWAMGVMYGIGGCSGFISPILFNWLLETYYFHGAVLILGGLALHNCAFGMLVRPPVQKKCKLKEEVTQSLEMVHTAESNSKNTSMPCSDARGAQNLPKSCDPKNEELLGELRVPLHVGVHREIPATCPLVNQNFIRTSLSQSDAIDMNESGNKSCDDNTEESVEEMCKPLTVDVHSGVPALALNAELSKQRDDVNSSIDMNGYKSSNIMAEDRLKEIRAALTHEVRVETPTSRSKAALKEIRQDLRLFKDGHFLLQLFNRSLIRITYGYFYSILPDFVEGDIKPAITKQEVAFVLSMATVGDVVVRLLAGPILDRLPWANKHSLAGVSVVMGITVLFFQFSKTYFHLMLGSVLFGVWLGVMIVVQYVVEIELIGPERVHMANGLIRFGVGATNVAAGVLIGYLRDRLGSYKVCLSLLGISAILGGLVWVMEPFVIKIFPPQLMRTKTGEKTKRNSKEQEL